jgi:hypothetical protein
MVSHLFYHQLALLALIWLFIMLHLGWTRRSATSPPALGTPMKPQRQRSTAPKTFEGLTHKPSCAWCEQDTGETNPAPPVQPDPMPCTNRRPRTVETSARVFEVDAKTVLHWLVEAAEELTAFSAYFLCDLHVKQLQLDELYAVLHDLKVGEIKEDEAIQRLERSPYWV